MAKRGNWGETGSWDECQAAQRAAALLAARRAARIDGYRTDWAKIGLSEADITGHNWEKLPLLSKEILIEAALRAHACRSHSLATCSEK